MTCILDRARQGDPKAAEELLPLVYQELRRIAVARMGCGVNGHTLQPTALVHKAWLRLVGGNGNAHYQNHQHFFSAAAEAMRHILIDRARRRQAIRRGGGQQRVDIDEIPIAAPSADDELLAVSEALERLASADPDKAELAKRRWARTRAWLFNEIRSAG